MPSLSELKKQNIQEDEFNISYSDGRFLFFKKYNKYIFLFLVLCYFFPQYPKRIIYPLLYGKKTDRVLDTNHPEYYEDVDLPSFNFTRNGSTYNLKPTVKYSGTYRIGIIDYYDTWFYNFYRGKDQKHYMDRTPLDLFLVRGPLAEKKVFNLFKFEHDERMGRMLCKGVKYKTSFMPSFYETEDDYKKGKAAKALCDKYYDKKNLDNYHPIPANNNVNRAFHLALPGDVIYIEGLLVDIDGKKTPTRVGMSYPGIMGKLGIGWCMTPYVTKVIINGYVYE